MDFALLGPLLVRGPGGAIELRAAKQRSLLAMLLLADGPVSSERLIDALWGDDPPPTAAKALRVYITHLRRALGPETIVTRSPGYAVLAGGLDLDRFAALARD